MTAKQYQIEGPEAVCPVKGCGLPARVEVKPTMCYRYGGCVHLVAIEQSGGRVSLIYVED